MLIVQEAARLGTFWTKATFYCCF